MKQQGSPSISSRTQPSSLAPNPSEAMSSVHFTALPSTMMPPRFPTGYSEKIPSTATVVPSEQQTSPVSRKSSASHFNPTPFSLDHETSAPTALPLRSGRSYSQLYRDRDRPTSPVGDGSEAGRSASQGGQDSAFGTPGPTLDGSEPRMFPGVVSGMRRWNSIKRSSQAEFEAGERSISGSGMLEPTTSRQSEE